MKKILLCLLTIISLFLISCEDKDSDDKDLTLKNPIDFSNISSIIGTWESTYEINNDGTTVKDVSREIVFNSDRTYIYYYGVYESHGTYTFSNSTTTCKKLDGLGYQDGNEIFKFEPKNEYITTITWQEYSSIINKLLTRTFLFKKTK